MKRRRTPALALLILTLASLPALGYFELLGQREAYRALEACRVIEGGGSYWGQILRYNVPHHPAWMRTCIRIASGTVAYLGVLAIAGLAIWTALAVLGASPSTGVSRRFAARYTAPLIKAALIFGLVLALTAQRMDRWVYESMYDLADALGCQYAIISGIRPLMLGGHGPFHGGPAADALNWFYVNGWPASPLVPPALASAAALWWLMPRHTTRKRGTCAACGYPLEGLRSTVCPECGGQNGA